LGGRSQNRSARKFAAREATDLAAHQRRARTIAQLHKRAMANDLSAQDKAIRADITERQETVFWMSIAGAFIVALGSILALLAMM
jgi:hypothetical protein